MQTKQLDITNFKDVLVGGASEIKLNIQAINDLNVFPVPDGPNIYNGLYYLIGVFFIG